MIPDKNLAEILAQRMHAGVPLPVPIALSILQQVCNGLEYAHNMRDAEGRPLGIVHGDVSPMHIYISEAGAVTLVGRSTPNGTFAYMAPEYVMAGMIDARADLFALGVVAHEMLANQPLFTGNSDREILDRVCQQPISPAAAFNPQVPPDLDSVVFTALARDPAYRWQYAGMMRDALLGTAHRLGIEVAAPYHPMWADVLAGRFEAPLSRPPRGLYDPPPSGQFEAAPAVQFDVPVPRFTPVPPELAPAPIAPAPSSPPAVRPAPTFAGSSAPPARFEAESTVEVSSLQVPARALAPDPAPELEPEEDPATLAPGLPAPAARKPEVWTDDDDGSTRIQPLDPAFLEAVSNAAASAAAPKAPKAATPIAPASVAPASVAPAPIAPASSAPAPIAPAAFAPKAIAPIAPIAPITPHAPAPITPPASIPRIMGGRALAPSTAPAQPIAAAPRNPSAPSAARSTGPVPPPPVDDRTLAEPVAASAAKAARPSAPIARPPLGDDRTLADPPGMVAPVARGPSANNGAADGVAPVGRGPRGKNNDVVDALAPIARGAPAVGRASTEQDVAADGGLAPVGRASTANDEVDDDGVAPVSRGATVAEQEFEDTVDGEEAPADALAPLGRKPRGNDQVAPVGRGPRAASARPGADSFGVRPVTRNNAPLTDAPLAPELADGLAAELAAAGARASSARVQRPTASPVQPLAPPAEELLELAPLDPGPAPVRVLQNQFDPELGPEPTQIGAIPLIAFGDVPLVSKIGEQARRTAAPAMPAPSATFLPEQAEPDEASNKKKIMILVGIGVIALIIVIILIAS